jgi:hypothetical protein
MLPRITLVTPSYNQAAFLQATLDSVLAQNYPHLEWIVMDGGSTDGSVEMLRRSAKHFAYWTSERDAGQADALNRGFARATGEIFGWLNSDDVLMPNALRCVGEYFARHPACHFLTGDGMFINADGTRELYAVRGAAYTLRELLHYCDEMYLPQPSVFFSRAAWERAGGLDISLHYAMDLDLWLRLRQHSELHYVPQRLSCSRIHPAAKGEARGQPALRAAEQVTRRYWHQVSAPERVKIFWGLRRMRARQYCRDGLNEALQGNPRAGWHALGNALRQDPSIVFASRGRPLLARLVLPMPLRRRLLRVP